MLSAENKSIKLKEKFDKIKQDIKTATTKIINEAINQQLQFLFNIEQIERELNENESITEEFINKLDFKFEPIKSFKIGELNDQNEQSLTSPETITHVSEKTTYHEINKSFDETNSETSSRENQDTTAPTLNKINLKTKLVIDKSIWETFKDMTALRKVNLNSIQKNELDKIHEQMKQEIQKHFFKRTTPSSAFRTTIGYNLQSKCINYNATKCKTLWNMKVDVNTGISVISSNLRCNHE